MTTLLFLPEFSDLIEIPTLNCTYEFSFTCTMCLEVRLSPGADCKMICCLSKLGAEYMQIMAANALRNTAQM